MSTTSKLMKRFESLSKRAEQFNSKTRTKRFHVMTHANGGRVVEIGLYDGIRKKFALTDIRAYNAMEILDEVEGMINTAS